MGREGVVGVGRVWRAWAESWGESWGRELRWEGGREGVGVRVGVRVGAESCGGRAGGSTVRIDGLCSWSEGDFKAGGMW